MSIQRLLKKSPVLTLLALSTGAMAAPNFDPDQKLEQGERIYSQSQGVIESNAAEISRLEAALKSAAEKIAQTDSQSEKMSRVLKKCAQTFESSSIGKIPTWTERFVEKERARINAAFQDLKQSVDKYKSAQACTQCDPEVREMTLAKYLEKITSDLQALPATVIDGNGLFEIQLESNRKGCNFNEFFEYYDDAKFPRLSHWGIVEYDALLSPGEIISSDFSGTLKYLDQKGTIRVERNTSAFGRAYSEFHDGGISIQLTYDWEFLTGYDNVRHPELTNPIYILHRDHARM